MLFHAGFALAQDAQGFGFIPSSGGPISIEADSGIEWHRNQSMYLAKGNAKAQSGDMLVEADELRGYYRTASLGGGDMQIYRLEASGNVRLTSGQHKATASQAFYDLDQKVFVLRGENLRLVTPQASMQASESIEYWQDKNLAVARGKAVAQQGQNRLMAEKLAAHFTGGQNLQVSRVDAEGGVTIQSKDNLAQSDKASYDLKSGLASLSGNVKMTQGQNQLNGEYAELNTATGVSRILGGKDMNGGQKRVRALVIPGAAKTTSPLKPAS